MLSVSLFVSVPPLPLFSAKSVHLCVLISVVGVLPSMSVALCVCGPLCLSPSMSVALYVCGPLCLLPSMSVALSVHLRPSPPSLRKIVTVVRFDQNSLSVTRCASLCLSHCLPLSPLSSKISKIFFFLVPCVRFD